MTIVTRAKNPHMDSQHRETLTILTLHFWLFKQRYLQAYATSNKFLKTWMMGLRTDIVMTSLNEQEIC